MLTPVGAPMGCSGDFSSAGARVFSAHCFSASEGWRSVKTSAIGDSTVAGFLESAITGQFSKESSFTRRTLRFQQEIKCLPSRAPCLALFEHGHYIAER